FWFGVVFGGFFVWVVVCGGWFVVFVVFGLAVGGWVGFCFGVVRLCLVVWFGVAVVFFGCLVFSLAVIAWFLVGFAPSCIP
ncbi:hypothetical protein, partial [Acinetobacter baumannii]|uniref:hypothetical protein n=1 Tax=Acinetobacter baumannii TaxID=470 RepID=UPI00148BB17E